MAGDKQPVPPKVVKPAGGKAFVIPSTKQSYQPVIASKNIQVVVVSKKPSIKPEVSQAKKIISIVSSKPIVSSTKSSNDKPKTPVSSKVDSKVSVRRNWWDEETTFPVISFSEEQPWYTQYPSFIGEQIEAGSADSAKIDEKKFAAISAKVQALYESETVAHAKAQAAASKGNSDQKWINDVIKSGTLSDKVAALALRIQESPFHHLETLDSIVAMACKKEQRTSQLALEAVKDLLINNLLPDRKLVAFRSPLLLHSDMTLSTALLLWFEGQLKSRVERVMEALDAGLKSSVDYFKKICMETAASLLISKPEQEARLLSLLAGKLGDTSSRTASKCIETLKNVLQVHPAMKGVVVREVRQFIYRPHNKMKAIFNGVLFLSQVTLQAGDHDVATQLVECYVSLFEKAVKEDELGSRLLSALLTGINKSFPFLDNIDPIVKYADSLFRLVHSASFTSSTQALMLLSHLAISNTDSAVEPKSRSSGGKKAAAARTEHTEVGSDEEGEDEGEGEPEPKVDGEVDAGNDITRRYYRTLYSKLLSDQVTSRAKNTLLLNLLYKSIKRDPNEHRAMAFLKRLAICASHASPSIAAGLLFLISEVLDSRPRLKKMLNASEEVTLHTTQDENLAGLDEETAYSMLGNFDAGKREPEYAAQARPSLWEAALLRRHFHPSVQAFAHSLLDANADHHINFQGDPTTDFSLMAFLNRFAYKNPKKAVAEKMQQQQRKTLSEEPINMSKFIHSEQSSVAPDKAFFHKFFGERERLRDEGRSRDRSRRVRRGKDDGEEEGSQDEAGSEADEEEIDAFANKLAEDLMREHDPDVDDEDEFSPDEGDSDDSEVFSDPDAVEGENGDEGSEDSEGSDEDQPPSDSDEEEEEEEERPAKKSGSQKSQSLDFADFLKLQAQKSSSSSGKKGKNSAKKATESSDSSDEDSNGGYGGLEVYNSEEDEDVAPVKARKDARRESKQEIKKQSKAAESSSKETKKVNKTTKMEDSEVDSDMEVMEFDEEGNPDEIEEESDEYDSEEDLDLIMGGESEKEASKGKKGKGAGAKSGKRKRGGESDFASADDYEAEMEAILRQIQDATGAKTPAAINGKTALAAQKKGAPAAAANKKYRK